MLGHQLEVVTEQYNAAKIVLSQREKSAAIAKKTVARVNRALRSLQGQVKSIAVSAYQDGQLTSFASFIDSSSAQGFLDRLSALDVIAHKQSTVFSDLSATKAAAQKAQTAAVNAETSARRTATALGAKRASISRQVSTLQLLMASLSSKERAAWVGQQATSNPNQLMQQQPLMQTGPPPPVSAKAAVAVAAAETQIGKPYVWGAAGPYGFDCSGLVLWAWDKAGVSLPHSSANQINYGTRVSKDQLRPGDLIFYYAPIHHVAMYVGNGMIIQASTFGVPVGFAPAFGAPFAGATRLS